MQVITSGLPETMPAASRQGNVPTLPAIAIPVPPTPAPARFPTITAAPVPTLSASAKGAAAAAAPDTGRSIALPMSDAPSLSSGPPEQVAAVATVPGVPASGSGATVPVATVPTLPVAQIAPLAIAIAIDPGNGATDIALSPDELGRLQMQVVTEGDSLRIAMTVERPDTLDLLRRHADQFLADLRQAGFGHATLSFASGGGEADARRAPDPAAELQTGETGHDAGPAVAAPHRSHAGLAALDLRL